jgi:hypothetical protein
MKIPEFKWSGIGLIAEFCRIPNGFPNQEQLAQIGSTQQEWWWQRGLSTASISTTGGVGPTSGLHPHVAQSLQKLELLPHSWWQFQQRAHQQDVHQTGPRSQSKCDKDQHDERVAHRSPQDNFTLSLRPHAPHLVPATCSHPSKLAAISAPHQLHQHDGADDAPHALALHGAAIWPYPSSCHSACTSCTHTTGRHDDGALLCTIPSASSFLTIRGK